MKLFAQTLSQYLTGISRQMIIRHTESRELRIFLSSFAPDIVYETGIQLREFLSAQPQQIEMVYKVGAILWNSWAQSEAPHFPQVLEALQREQWVDTEDRLTYYRNLQWGPDSHKDCLIVVLIGIEQARDQASLKDFYLVDATKIWHEELHRSFAPWIHEIMQRRQIATETEHIQQMDELLKRLYRYGVGDLMRIAEFLESLPLEGAQDGLDALNVMYETLPFWDLPVLRDIPSQRKTGKYVEEAMAFFSYQRYLKEFERKKVLKKIDRFEKAYNDGKETEFPEEFADASDFVNCLRRYIKKNDPQARRRLRETNFVFIQDRILGVKSSPKESTPKSLKKLDSPPLEAILRALWVTLVAFTQECERAKILPAKALRTIRLTGMKFAHDLEDNSQAAQLLHGMFGGIDAFLEEYLTLTPLIDGEQKHIALESHILPEEGIGFGSSRASIPGFEFSVTFEAEDHVTVRMFRLMLPATHAYRNIWNFARMVREELKNARGPVLPVFHLPYYHELFLAPDEEEANRIFMLALKHLTVRNLLNDPEVKKQRDPLLFPIEDLSSAYGAFLQEFVEDGYFTAVRQTWAELITKTEAVLRPVLTEEAKTVFTPLLYKAFMLLREPPDGNRGYFWESFVDSAVMTGIHPLALDMLRHRETFLIHGFLDNVQTVLQDVGGQKLSEQHWQAVCDLATMHYPVFGVICNQKNDIDTRIESLGTFHRIGRPEPNRATLAAKVLLRYDAPEDDDISESDLFCQTRESQVITRILHEYLRLHAYAQDGISILVVNAVRIQPLIAGIDAFLKTRLEKPLSTGVTHTATSSENPASDNWSHTQTSAPPYHFSLTLVMPASDSEVVSRWLQEWRKRWDPAQALDKFQYYQRCRLSISHRIIGHYKEYADMLKKDDVDADIAILTHFINSEETGNEIEPAEPYRVDYDDLLKFPILEMARCIDDHPSRMYIRARVLSNRRFRLATLHSELTARLKNPMQPAGQEHIVISKGDYTPWIPVVDRLHQKATWVLCLDPLVDERLVGQADHDAHWKREIIGFSSGVGLHGELNYTVSTERSTLNDIKVRIQNHLLRLFGPWSEHEIEKAAHTLVHDSRKLSGLSLVRATGPGEYVRDLIAYTLVRRSLPQQHADGIFLCDELLALDSFLHWFDNSETRERPDLMRIVAFLEHDGNIRMFVSLIECKLGKSNMAHLEKARVQLESGLRHLIPLFMPRQRDRQIRFDQRFWWTQLQRLIATKAIIKPELQQRVTSALEKLGSGHFHIDWQAMAVTFWTDTEQQTFSFDPCWNFQELQQEFVISVITGGPDVVKTICLGKTPLYLPQNERYLSFEYHTEAERNIVQGHQKLLLPPLPEELTPSSASIEDSPDTQSINIAETLNPPESIVKDEELLAISTASPVPERVFLGQTKEGRDVFWEFGHPELPNRHVLIFGKSGSGKTYAIQALLCELSKHHRNSLIVDYTNGFLPKHLEANFRTVAHPQSHVVLQQPLPLNPFRRRGQIIDDALPAIMEDAYAVGARVMSVFTSVYSTIGEQQTAALVKAVAEGVEMFGDTFDFEQLLHRLEEEGNVGLSLSNKLQPLIRSRLFTAGHNHSWERLFQDTEHWVNILQLAGVPREISRMATEFILWDVYDFATNSGNKDRPLPIVLDEIQNLDHRLNSPLAKILTEGRKFGLSMILATQTLSNLHTEEKDRLFQASQKLFFKPADTEVREYARILEHATNEKAEVWITRLSSLTKGECYAVGPSLNQVTGQLEEKAFRIKITALEEREKATILEGVKTRI